MATPTLGFDNFFSTTLSGNINGSSDTVIPLNAAPTASEGFLVVEPDSSTNHEIIYYTSKGASSVTCPSFAAGRGVGGTTAISHSSGATVKMMVVAEMFEALQDGTGLATGIQVVQKSSNPYKFSVYRNAALTSASSYTAVAFDTKLFDTGTNIDVVTNKGRFTAPITGFYHFSASLGNTAATNTFMGIALYVNGSQKLVGQTADPSQATSSGTKLHVSGLLSLTAADYVEVYFLGGSGSTIEVGAGACWFNGFLVSNS